MPLAKNSVYGGECPLGKFRVDVAAGGGCYTADPVACCHSCNFADLTAKGFDLEKICQCPADMTWEVYDVLKAEYAQMPGEKTRRGFQKFVRINYNKLREQANQGLLQSSRS